MKISMGEFSYGGGISAGFLALILSRNRFDVMSLVLALCLVTLASLFKIYFALFGVVVIAAYAAVAPIRRLIICVAPWLAATFFIYFALTQSFPNYFELTYGIVSDHVSRSYGRIIPQLGWFLLNFGFIIPFAVPALVGTGGAVQDESRRGIYYLSGGLAVALYVVFAMLPHIGNFGTYLLHVIAPIVLAYPLGRVARHDRLFEQWAGVTGTLALILIVFIIPKYDGTRTVRWTGWKAYGVVSRPDLDGNRDTAHEIESILHENVGKSIYLDFALAPVAIANGLEYVDAGNREFIPEYFSRKVSGGARSSLLVDILAPTNNFTPSSNDPYAYMDQANIVICALRCPAQGTHQFLREVGPLYFAFNARAFPVMLYSRMD
jgi:hypothetical protein